MRWLILCRCVELTAVARNTGCCHYLSLRSRELEGNRATSQRLDPSDGLLFRVASVLDRRGANEIYNYYPLPNGLGSSGPSPPQFADIRAAGFNVVVNLAMPHRITL